MLEMNRQIKRQKEVDNETPYGIIWRHLQNFPNRLAKGSKNSPNGTGPAAAALISAGFGCFMMMVTHHLSDTSKVREKIVWSVGSWIPGSHNPSSLWGNIGSYTGKETMLLVGWLTSWLILHFLWKNQDIKARIIFFWVFAFFIVATVMSWHPLFPYLTLM